MSKYLDLFVTEAGEHIQAAGGLAKHLAAGDPSPETLHALFRHFHSIKGMAASMGFEPIARLSHAVENLFDLLRKGQRGIDTGVGEIVVEALDMCAAMVAEAGRAGVGTPLAANPAGLIARLRELLPAGAPKASSPPHAADRPSEAPVYEARLLVHPRADLPGARAALALSRLETIGVILACHPPRESLSGSSFAGEVVLRLRTDRSERAVRAVLEGVPDLARLNLQRETATAPPDEAVPATLRLPTSTLDEFLDIASALITRRGALSEALKAQDLPGALGALGKLSESLETLRGRIMEVRLLPFEQIVPRLERTVRDLCRRTGKRVRFTVEGAGIALDRSVLEELLDPLTHILRNAVDHGIDLPAEREARGKPPEGSITLHLARHGDQVEIQVQDDGRGIDAEAIARAALRDGFVTEPELSGMDESRILMLTTTPGFSTAPAVTEISGRGVGMDVVRTRIEALHGHMRIRSHRGEGTCIEMILPLTVAVIDAFLVDSRDGVFALPSSQVEGVEAIGRDRIRASGGSFFAASPAGDDFRPIVRLDSAGSSPGEAIARDLQALSCRAGQTRRLIVVDRIRERRQLVVRPLGPPLEHLRRYSGAAILDDGGLALVLDPMSLAEA